MHGKPSTKLGIILILRTLGIIRMYRLVFASSCLFFVFCNDDSEMLRLSKKLSIFSMMFYRETSQLTPTFLSLLPLLKPRLHNKTWRLFRRNNFIFQFADRIAIFQTTRFLLGCPSPSHTPPLSRWPSL